MRGRRLLIRLVIGAIIIAFAFWTRYTNTEINPYTGKEQVINLSSDEEIAIGLQNTPHMEQEYGGLYPSQEGQDLVRKVGNNLVNNSIARETPYKYNFHLLADPNTVNAFALPGGQVFITYALFSRLENEDQLAGVLGHEIGHVLGRHSAERIANSEFWKSVSQGAQVGANAGQVVNGIGNRTLLGNSREDELESDDLGVRFMIKAGYNPDEMIRVMEILKASSGPSQGPEYQSDHPSPDNRIQHIKASIKKYQGSGG